MAAPDYTRYTLDELYDAHSHIDRDAWPERLAALEAEISEREKQPELTSPDVAETSQEEPPAGDVC